MKRLICLLLAVSMVIVSAPGALAGGDEEASESPSEATMEPVVSKDKTDEIVSALEKVA
jgi:hypothetical protein